MPPPNLPLGGGMKREIKDICVTSIRLSKASTHVLLSILNLQGMKHSSTLTT